MPNLGLYQSYAEHKCYFGMVQQEQFLPRSYTFSWNPEHWWRPWWKPVVVVRFHCSIPMITVVWCLIELPVCLLLSSRSFSSLIGVFFLSVFLQMTMWVRWDRAPACPPRDSCLHFCSACVAFWDMSLEIGKCPDGLGDEGYWFCLI